jgi:hypothetical protein
MQLPFALGDLVFVARTVDPSPDPLSLGTFGRLWPLFVCVPFVLFAVLVAGLQILYDVRANERALEGEDYSVLYYCEGGVTNIKVTFKFHGQWVNLSLVEYPNVCDMVLNCLH